MKDSITEIELNLEFSRAAEIVQEWAAAAKFTAHEKTSRSALYHRYQNFGTTFWVYVEYLGQKVKLSAWVAPKGLEHDQEGSFWKGNKRPVPIGFTFGPIGRFKKQFADLLKRLHSESNNISAPIMQNERHSALSKENFAKGLVTFSIIVFLNGVLSVYNASYLMSNQLFPDFGAISLQRGIIDIVIGVILFITSRFLKSGKAFSIWLYGMTVMLSVGQDLAIGAKFPFFTVLFGVWVISQLVGLKKQGQLA